MLIIIVRLILKTFNIVFSENSLFEVKHIDEYMVGATCD